MPRTRAIAEGNLLILEEVAAELRCNVPAAQAWLQKHQVPGHLNPTGTATLYRWGDIEHALTQQQPNGFRLLARLVELMEALLPLLKRGGLRRLQGGRAAAQGRRGWE